MIISIFSLIIVNIHLKFTTTDSIKHERTIIRKYFHFLAIVVYTSGILFDTHLLTMCSIAFLVLLLLLEVEKHTVKINTYQKKILDVVFSA